MSQLALTGGPALAADLQSMAGPWPRLGDAEAEALVRAVLHSGRWCRLHPDSYAERFENAFAAYHDARHGIAAAGTTAPRTAGSRSIRSISCS